MGDPGRSFLYEDGRREAQHASDHTPMKPHSPTLAMSPLPRINAGSADWQAAVGNVENAKLALDTLKTLVSDAVFLDEEAFTNATTLSLYQQRIQVGRRGPLWTAASAASGPLPSSPSSQAAAHCASGWLPRCTASSAAHGAARAAAPADAHLLLPAAPLQSQQRKTRDLEHQVEALRAEAEGREEALSREVQARKVVQQHARELQAELDNNAGGWATGGAAVGAAGAADIPLQAPGVRRVVVPGRLHQTLRPGLAGGLLGCGPPPC
jgi:hypothetical protein